MAVFVDCFHVFCPVHFCFRPVFRASCAAPFGLVLGFRFPGFVQTGLTGAAGCAFIQEWRFALALLELPTAHQMVNRPRILAPLLARHGSHQPPPHWESGINGRFYGLNPLPGALGLFSASRWPAVG